MNAKFRNGIFGLICLAQLGVPVSLVVKHEQTRRTGTEWRFQTAPVDPNDPFRGRYVQLAFAAERDPVPMADEGLIYIRWETRMYAELAKDANGFARLTRLHQQRPERGDYLDVFVTRMWSSEKPEEQKSPPSAYVRLPFDRYYLPEDRAMAVELAYRDASLKAQNNTWAQLRVREGHAALVDLVLDGKPVSGS